jgi:hypothetical protein
LPEFQVAALHVPLIWNSTVVMFCGAVSVPTDIWTVIVPLMVEPLPGFVMVRTAASASEQLLSIVTFEMAGAETAEVQSGSVPLAVMLTPASGVPVPQVLVSQEYSHRLEVPFHVMAPFVTLQPVLPVIFTTMPVMPDGVASVPTCVWIVTVPLTVLLFVGFVVVNVAGSLSVHANGFNETTAIALLVPVPPAHTTCVVEG